MSLDGISTIFQSKMHDYLFRALLIFMRYILRFLIINILFYLQEGSRGDRKEGGKRGRKPGRKAADKADMKAKLGKVILLGIFADIYIYIYIPDTSLKSFV